MTENTFDYYDVEETPSNRNDGTKDLLIVFLQDIKPHKVELPTGYPKDKVLC